MKEEMQDRIKKWLDTLNENERCQAEILDSYFTFRRNLPDADPVLGRAIEDHKTTVEIIDDLEPMMDMSKSVVTAWLRSHDYHITTIGDGSPKWAIWRFIDTTLVT